MSKKHIVESEPAVTTEEAVCTAEPEQNPVKIETEHIARLAYAYWLEGGCQEGTAENDWLRAETELRGTSETKSMAVTA